MDISLSLRRDVKYYAAEASASSLTSERLLVHSQPRHGQDRDLEIGPELIS